MGGCEPEAQHAIALALQRDREAFERACAVRDRDRRNLRRGRWPLVVGTLIFYLFVVSPLCIGPASYLHRRDTPSSGESPAMAIVFSLAAWPSVAVLLATGQERPLMEYSRWWQDLADSSR